MTHRFPSEQLSVASGEIAAFIFENPTIGLRRSMWWSVTMQFNPITYADADWECSMTTDWIPWKLRDWRNLEGQTLRCNYGDNDVEASFYLVEHDQAEKIELSIGRRVADKFDVRMRLLVDFSGYFGDDADPELSVSGELLLSFTGIVVPDSLFPKPVSAEDAAEIAAAFVDVDLFEQPENRGHGWLLRPRLGN